MLHAATASEKLKVKTSKISLSKGFLELQKVDLTWWQTPSLVEVQLSVFLKAFLSQFLGPLCLWQCLSNMGPLHTLHCIAMIPPYCFSQSEGFDIWGKAGRGSTWPPFKTWARLMGVPTCVPEIFFSKNSIKDGPWPCLVAECSPRGPMSDSGRPPLPPGLGLGQVWLSSRTT